MRQLPTDLQKCTYSLLFRIPSEVQHIFPFLCFSSFNIPDKIAEHNRLPGKQRIRIQFFLHKRRRAHNSIYTAINLPPIPIERLCCSQTAPDERTMNTPAGNAADESPGQALVTCLMRSRPIHIMAWTYKLGIMGCIDNAHFSTIPFPVLLHRQQYRWCQLIIKIVDMHHIRLKFLEELPHLPFCFYGINELQWIHHIGPYTAFMKIHSSRIQTPSVSHRILRMIHPKIFNFMALSLPVRTQLKYISFCTPCGIQKLIDH